jgi:hypothetical protein
MTLKRFDEDPRGESRQSFNIDIEARIGGFFTMPWCAWQAVQASNRVHRGRIAHNRHWRVAELHYFDGL